MDAGAQQNSSALHTAGVVLTGAMAIFMVNLDATVVNIVLPKLCTVFNLTTAQSSLIVMAYLLSLTGTALIFGRLSDMLGPERLFMAGYAVFILGSGLCALGWDLWTLCAFRFVQGLGGAMIFATSAVIVMRYVPEKKRGRAYAVNGAMAGLGFAMGSPVGGFLSNAWDWRAVFLVNIPVGLLGLALCWRFLELHGGKRVASKFDVPGAAASFFTLALLVVTLHSVSDGRVGLPFAVGLACAVGLGWLFIRLERRSNNPLVQMSIFCNKRLNYALAATAFFYAFLQGTALVLPFFLIHARGLTSSHAGGLLALGSITTIFLSPVVGWLCDKTGPRLPALFGAGLFIAASAMFLGFDAGTPTWGLIAALLVYGVGICFFSAPILTLTMSHADPETMGVLSSVKSVGPSVVGMLGVGTLATVYTLQSGGDTPEGSIAGFHSAIVAALGIAVLCLLCTVLTRAKEPR